MIFSGKKILPTQIDKEMPSSRNIVLAVLIIAIALGVVYMLDPTFGGLLGRKYEGFNTVVNTTGAASMNGEPAGAFHNSGAADAHAVNAARHNESNEGETVSPMMPGAGLAEGFESLNPSPMPFAGAEKPANCYPKNQLAQLSLILLAAPLSKY